MYFFSKWFKILNSNFIFLIFKAKGANLNFARCTIQRCDVTCRQVAVSQGSINHVTGQARPTSQPQDLLVPCNPQRENASIRASNPCQVSTGRKREGGGGDLGQPSPPHPTDIGRLSDLETIICVCFRYLNMAKNERTNEILVGPPFSYLGGACQTRDKQHSFVFVFFLIL